MGCFGECLELGPPPDTILFLPPPPAPTFLQHTLPDLLLNTTPCSAAQLCESFPSTNRIPDGADYIELSRKDVENWSVTGIDDTWLLVLVASSIGVLLLGALLAMFLLKCREMNMFGHNECSMHQRQSKNPEPRDCSSMTNLNSNKLVHPADSVLYHGTHNMQDNRMVWAALTPRGTQHFISENYPRDLIHDYNIGENEDHYETIDNLHIPSSPPQLPTTYLAYQKDYDYEDPTPLIESYQMNDVMLLEHNGNNAHNYQILMSNGGNTDMRCASLAVNGGSTLRRGISIRPQVSSPTRIEHPNLPPLNMYPHNNSKNNTLKKNGTLNYRHVDAAGTLPKYGC